ncbi:MAG: hypothetical protein ABR551_07400 [Gemmatimonadales bacterium]
MSAEMHAPETAAAHGASIAAVMAAGIGALAMGLFVIANEAGIYSAPSLYAGAGGLSGRSTFAVITWLVAWAVLHRRWKTGGPDSVTVLRWTLILTVIGVVLCFPPVWGLLG